MTRGWREPHRGHVTACPLALCICVKGFAVQLGGEPSFQPRTWLCAPWTGGGWYSCVCHPQVSRAGPGRNAAMQGRPPRSRQELAVAPDWGPSGVGVGVFSGLRAGLGQGPCFTCRGASGGGQLRPGLPPPHHPPSPGACLFTKHLASTHCVLGPAPSTFSRQLPGARFADEEPGAQR